MQSNWNIASLSDWQVVTPGAGILFEVVSGFRNILFDFIADHPVIVHAVMGGEVYVLAVGEGLNRVKFAANDDASVVFEPQDSAHLPVIRLRTKDTTQLLSFDADEPFTEIMPVRSGPSEDIKRMMHVMRLNQERRERQLESELEAMRQRMSTLMPKKKGADGVVREKKASDQEKTVVVDDADDTEE